MKKNFRKEAIIYLAEFLASLSFTVLASFYPGIAESKGIPISLIGFILSLDPIVGLPTSILVGKAMTRISRKKILIVGLVFGGLGTLFLGMVDFFEGTNAILVSFTSRIFAGFGAGCSMTASSSILVQEYPNDIDRVISYFEAASGLGLLLGPVFGSLLNLYRISVTFTALALFFIGFALFTYKYLDVHEQGDEVVVNLPLKLIITKPKLLIDFFAQMWLMFILGYLSTVIELYLRDIGVPNNLVGPIYSVCLLVYFVASVLENQLLRCFKGRILTCFGIFLTGVGLFFIGPVIDDISNQIYVVIFGLAALGLGGALMYVPTTSNIISNAVNLYKIEYNEGLVDKIAVFTNFICNVGEIFGPILAGILTEYLGFRLGFFVVALVTFGFFIFYYFSMIFREKDSKASIFIEEIFIKEEGLISIKA